MVTRKRGARAAKTHTLLLVLVCFLLGLGVGVYWYHRTTKHPLPDIAQTDTTLAASTKGVLKTLKTPVTIHYYSLLDSASTSDSLRDFAERVNQLLFRYEREAGGKISVTRLANPADASAASAAGVKAFNLDTGRPCFLGVALACNDQKETLGQLSPDWEGALESDLTRAIARLTAATAGDRATPMNASPPDAVVVAEVRRLIPNLESVSLSEGKQILRDVALKEIKEATEETQRRVNDAQQRITLAQASSSEAEKQAALKQLQQVQAGQTEKLKELAAQTQMRITVFEQIKK